jgi:hypothetical protein
MTQQLPVIIYYTMDGDGVLFGEQPVLWGELLDALDSMRPVMDKWRSGKTP